MRWIVLAAAIGAGCSGSGSSSTDAHHADAPADVLDVDAVSFPANAPPIGTCDNGWCWVYPLPQGWPIGRIFGTSANDVWAVPELTNAGREAFLHFDGTTWSAYPIPAGCRTTLNVWGAAANDVWAVGDCLLHWDGSAWTGPSLGYQVEGVIGGVGASNVWRFNNDGTFRWDGTQWEQHSGSIGAMAVGGSGSTTLAVSSQRAIWQWTGTAWGLVDAGNNNSIAKGAVVIDATHIVVLEGNGDLWFWNSGTWTTQTAPASMTATQLAASSPSDVWIAGATSGGQVVYHWNGTSWSPTGALISAGHPTTLWLEPSGALWLGSDSSEIAIWNGAAWSAKTTGANRTSTVWGSDWDNIWTLGDGNIVTHWNGSAWSETPFPYSLSDFYFCNGGWASAPDDVWIAGGKATGLGYSPADRVLFHWNGLVWSSSSAFGTENYDSNSSWYPRGFAAIWGAAANDIYAVAPTAVYHFDGNNWTKVLELPGGARVFGSGANDVYVSTYDGHLWRWDGASWKMLPIGGGDGWANSPTDVWLGCGHYDGSVCVPYTTPFMYGVYAPIGTSTDMFAFDNSSDSRVPSEAIEWVGGFSGTTRSAGVPQLPPSSRWRTPDGHIFLAGGGLIVH